METITVKQALGRGFRTVSLPVMIIMFMPWLLCWAQFSQLHRMTEAAPAVKEFAVAICLVLVAASILSIPAAWLWWSIAIPKWKLWAYARVDDLAELKDAAIEANLIWPDGHVFEWTELCSKETRRTIRALEGRA